MISPLILAFVVLLAVAAPVSVAMGLAAAIAILWGGKAPINTVVTQMVSGMDSFPLMAIPFFILAGELMERAGISEKLVHLAKTMVGHIQGGLGMVVLVGEYLFSGISGSTAADISAIGSAYPLGGRLSAIHAGEISERPRWEEFLLAAKIKGAVQFDPDQGQLDDAVFPHVRARGLKIEADEWALEDQVIHGPPPRVGTDVAVRDLDRLRVLTHLSHPQQTGREA